MMHHMTDHLTFGLEKETEFEYMQNAKNKLVHKSSQIQS
jgi:hypothetical protein